MDDIKKLKNAVIFLVVLCLYFGYSTYSASRKLEKYSDKIEALESYVDELEADVENYREELDYAYADIVALENDLIDAYGETYDIEDQYCYLDAVNKTYHRKINFTDCTFPQLIELAFPDTHQQFLMSKQCANMLFGANPCPICYAFISLELE